MSNIVPFPTARHVNDSNVDVFGGCPHCGCLDNIWNVFKSHWAVCHRHRTKWYVGENLFSNWKQESEADWTRNRFRLAEYREVESVHPDQDGAA